MLRHVSVDVSSEYYKRNLTLTLTLNLLLSLRLYHFYGLLRPIFYTSRQYQLDYMMGIGKNMN